MPPWGVDGRVGEGWLWIFGAYWGICEVDAVVEVRAEAEGKVWRGGVEVRGLGGQSLPQPGSAGK